MTKKKSFADNPAMAFITPSQPPEGQTSIEDYLEDEQKPQQAVKDPATGYEVPPGYRLVRETKSRRLQLLVRPSLLKVLKEEAAARNMSVNSLIDELLTDALKRI